MPTNQRKERRQKELLGAGRHAKEIEETALRAQQVAEENLVKAMDELEGLRVLPNDLRDAFVVIGKYEREGEKMIRTNAKLREEFKLAQDTVVAQGEVIQKREKELAVIKRADKDAAKLRKRLAKKTEEIDELQAKLNVKRKKDAEERQWG